VTKFLDLLYLLAMTSAYNASRGMPVYFPAFPGTYCACAHIHGGMTYM